MLYDPIFSKSFSRFEQQKIGRFAFFGCFVIALSICTVFKPQYHVRIVPSINLQFPRSDGVMDTAVMKDKNISEPLQYLSTGTDLKVDRETMKDTPLMQSSTTDAVKHGGVAAKNIITSEPLQKSGYDGVKDGKEEKDIITSKPVQSSTNEGVKAGELAKYKNFTLSLFEAAGVNVKDTNMAKDTTAMNPVQSATDEGAVVSNDNALAPEPIEVEAKLNRLVCSLSEPISDYCEIEGDIRIHPNSSTIFVVSHHTDSSFKIGTSWVIRPYARKGNEGAMESVKSWTIKVIPSHQTSPSCTKNQNIPAILFSLAGYSGNHFHDFSDIIIPLFSTSRKFNGEVHFLASDYKSWWSSKYRGILEKLSRHRVNDIDREEGILCYKSMIIGLKTRKELGIAHASNIYEGFSMKDFRDFLPTH